MRIVIQERANNLAIFSTLNNYFVKKIILTNKWAFLWLWPIRVG
jgi:hypothetical protein